MFRLFGKYVFLIGRKEVDKLAIIYVALSVKGKRTVESVPALLKPQVKELLGDLELDSVVTE